MAEAGRGPAAPVAALVFNAAVWGLSWWPFRRLEAHGVHPLWSTALVFAACFVLLLGVRGRDLPAVAGRPLLLALGLASGITNVCFNWAVTVGDVVRVVLLFYLMPAWSVLLAWLLLGEKPDLAAIARLLLALAGVAIVLDANGHGIPWPRTGPDLLALAGGFSFAATNVLLRRLDEEVAGARVLAMFGGGTLVAGGTALVATGLAAIPALPAPGTAWVATAALLAAGFLGGNVALQYGATRLPAQTTALVMLSEVVFASLSSVAFGAAQLGARTLAGGALIFAAAAWSAWPRTPRANGAQ